MGGKTDSIQSLPPHSIPGSTALSTCPGKVSVRLRELLSGCSDNIAVFPKFGPGSSSDLRTGETGVKVGWASNQVPPRPSPSALCIRNRGPKGELRVTVVWCSLDAVASCHILKKNLS